MIAQARDARTESLLNALSTRIQRRLRCEPPGPRVRQACALPLVALTLILAGGCAVGPDFKKPAPPEVSSYTASPLPAALSGTKDANIPAGQSQHLVEGAQIAADWWALFHSAPLNALVAQALDKNPDLKAAQAALGAAHEDVLAQRGTYYPNVSASFSASRQRQSGQLAPTPASNETLFNLFTPEVNVSYVPDVFGLNRRTVESLQAQEDSVRYQLAATYLTLTSNVVVTAIQQASVQAQIEATRQLIEINSNLLKILRYQFEKGYASGVDVAAQESQLAQVAATLPPLVKQSAQLGDLLAVLAGHFPNEAVAKFELTSLALPEELPVSLPSALVAQRPDVLQAEANMHSASAKIGIARANRLPNITLTGGAGSTALALDQLFTSGSNFWSVGGAITAPLFEGGTLLHQERSARAAYVQASEQYRSTVLTAFQNVADTLTALAQDAEALQAAATAADAAKVTLDLAQRQWQAGYASYASLLSAEQTYQQSRINLVQSEASRFADTAALYQALGGGWWQRADLAQHAQ